MSNIEPLQKKCSKSPESALSGSPQSMGTVPIYYLLSNDIILVSLYSPRVLLPLSITSEQSYMENTVVSNECSKFQYK